MKKLFFVFTYAFFFIVIFITGCKTETEKKITDIPLNSSSADAIAAFKQGVAFIDLGDYQAAKPYMTKAVELDPKFSVAYLFKVMTELNSLKAQTEDINKAKASLDTATATEWEKLYIDLYNTYLTADWSKRVEIAEKIAHDYPYAARAQADLGYVYQSGNEFDKARAAFEKAIELDSAWVGGYVYLSGSYLFNDPKDFSKAEAYALKVVEMDPKGEAAQITLGDSYRAQNNLEKAREAYLKAVELDTTSYNARYKLGFVNSFLGNYEEATKNFMDGSRLDESKFQYITDVPINYLLAGDYKKALQYIKSEIPKIDASSESRDILINDKLNCLYAIFTIAMHNNDLADMKESAPMIDSLNLENAGYLKTPESMIWAKEGSLYDYAMIDIVAGKLDSAKAKAETLKTIMDPIQDPTKLSDYHFILGQLALKQKNYTEAISQLEKVNPYNTYSKYWLAKANELAGNKDKAVSMYKEIAVYNFGDVGYAMIRDDAKKKAAGM